MARAHADTLDSSTSRGSLHPGGEAVTIDLRRLLATLRQRAWLILLVSGLFVAAAIAFLALTPPRFVATAQIIVDPRGLQVLDKDINPRAQNPDAHVPLIESEMRVLKSTKVLDLLIDREGLERDPEFTGGRWSPVGALKSLVTDLFGRERRAPDLRVAVLNELDERVAVRRAERSFVIDITVMTRDPEKSARLANALVHAYMEESAAAQAESARRSGEALSSRLEELRGRVRDAEDRVEQFRAQNNIVSTSGRLVGEQQLTELNNQLGVARTRTAEARAKVEQIERLHRGDAGAFTEAVQSQTVMALRAQFAEIKRRHADLATKLGERHPDMAAIERELRDAQAAISSEVARIARAARADFERAKASESALQASLDNLSRNAVSTSQAFVKLRELEREVEANRAVYQSALVRTRELKEQTLVDTTNVRHITVATPPLRASNPPAALVLPLALAVGLFAGGAAVFAGRIFDRKVRSRDDLERAIGMPVLGRVPRPSAESPLASFEPATPEAKAFRQLLDEIGAASGRTLPRSIGVVSVEPDSGSANVAFNLARAAAALGDRVLLIDASVEQRHLTILLECDRQPGLGLCAAQEALDLRAFIVSLQGAGVDFLPSDERAAAEIRRFGSAGLTRLLREALARYTLVVIDLGCPSREPLARTGGMAEAAVVLVELDRSAFETIKAAVAALRSAQIRVAGLALSGRALRAA
jgi:polysaccharide biosynthesis transport protein